MTLENEKGLLGEKLATDLEAKRLVEESEKKAAKIRKEKEDAKKKRINVVLKNTLGEEVLSSDYFFSKDGEDTIPSFFSDSYGYPVDREDMLGVFNKIFKPKDGMLFYKAKDKEVYVVIVPLKHSSTVGLSHNSIDGEFQKHALSFVTEGSVNLDTLRNKLIRVASTIKIVAE